MTVAKYSYARDIYKYRPRGTCLALIEILLVKKKVHTNFFEVIVMDKFDLKYGKDDAGLAHLMVLTPCSQTICHFTGFLSGE